LVKEGILFPDVSFGAGYNRLMGSVLVPVNIGDQTFDIDGKDLVIQDPKLDLGWTTDSFDFTIQVSKKVLFLRPFAGLGYSLGSSKVAGGLKSSMEYDGSPVTEGTIDGIIADMIDAGIPAPSLSTSGFLFSATNADPVLRVYGGVSLSLLFLNLDLQGIYVPKTKGLGANAMIRVQL
jgi:hypothetical protein